MNNSNVALGLGRIYAPMLSFNHNLMDNRRRFWTVPALLECRTVSLQLNETFICSRDLDS